MNHVNNCFLLVQICISRWKVIICLSSLYTNSWYIFLTVSFSSVDGYIRISCWEPFINDLYDWHIWMLVEAGKQNVVESLCFSLWLSFVCENSSLIWDHLFLLDFYLRFNSRHWCPFSRCSTCRTESDGVVKVYGSVQFMWKKIADFLGKMGFCGESWIYLFF